MNEGAVGRTVIRIALAKQSLPMWEAFFRGVLCNVLVCMAVWMAMAGRSVVGRHRRQPAGRQRAGGAYLPCDLPARISVTRVPRRRPLDHMPQPSAAAPSRGEGRTALAQLLLRSGASPIRGEKAHQQQAFHPKRILWKH